MLCHWNTAYSHEIEVWELPRRMPSEICFTVIKPRMSALRWMPLNKVSRLIRGRHVIGKISLDKPSGYGLPLLPAQQHINTYQAKRRVTKVTILAQKGEKKRSYPDSNRGSQKIAVKQRLESVFRWLISKSGTALC